MGNQTSSAQVARNPYPRRAAAPARLSRSADVNDNNTAASPTQQQLQQQRSTTTNPLAAVSTPLTPSAPTGKTSTPPPSSSPPPSSNAKQPRLDVRVPPNSATRTSPGLSSTASTTPGTIKTPSSNLEKRTSGATGGTQNGRSATSATAQTGPGTTSGLFVRPKLTVAEAKELFQSIFSPRQGELETIVCGFLQASDYKIIGLYMSKFLSNDMRDKWYLDTPMLAVLGRDRWRSSRNNTEASWPIKPNKHHVRNFIRQRREYTDQLRERLMRASGAAAEAEHPNHRYSLQNLLHMCKHNDDAISAESAGAGAEDVSAPQRSSSSMRDKNAGPSSLLYQTDSTVSSLASSFVQPSDGLYVTRLRTTVSTSFDCYTLMAKRIPQEVIKSFFQDYLLLQVPINDARLRYEEQRVGDLSKMSFFVSMQNRARMLQGLPHNRSETGQDMASSSDVTLAASTKNYEECFFLHTFKKLEKQGNKSTPITIENGAELFTALRNLAMIITTASSSMVLDALFNIAEVIKGRQRFRELRQDAADRGVAFETLIGADKASVRPYLGVPGENVAEWKRWTTTEEMSLATFTHLILQRFVKENDAKIQKLRKSFPDLFALLDKHALHGDREVDATRLLSNVAFKLMFLIGGGQRSIEADDRRVPMGARNCTDDLTLSRALEVPVLNRICWVGSMLSMPMMSSRGLLIQERQGRPLSFGEAEECTVVMRELFMAVGALPSGKHCPHKFTEWLNIFPLHAVNTEGKRILMYLYMTQYTAIRPMAIPVQKDMVLLSFAKRLASSKKFDRKGVCSYLFQPVFSVGYEDDENMEEEEASKAMRRQRRAAEKHSLLDTRKSLEDTSTSGVESGIGYDYGFSDAMGNSTSIGSQKNKTSGTTSPAKKDKGRSGGKGTSLAEDDSDESDTSVSTLMDSGLDIDVYTCVSLQSQLYLRCANEATVRRHKMTELTPCVVTEFFNGEDALRQGRKDIASTLMKRIPSLMPSEAFLIIHWKDNEPVVTVHEGDYLSVMVERARDNTSGIYFRKRGSSAGIIPQRSHSIVSIDAPGPTPTSPEEDTTDAAMIMRLDGEGSMYSLFGSSDNSSFNFGDDVMGGLLGVESIGTSKRFGMRWQVQSVHPLKQLLSLSERARIKQENHGELPEELVLVVSSATAPLTEPLRIITIGHERSFMSPFTQLGDASDACWSNPQLMLATVYGENEVAGGGHSAADSRKSSLATSMTSIASVSMSAFCRTEDELQRVFFATGVLLANTIANAVYFSIPFAPLAFSLFKKAVQSGDYSFRSFTWLEPCEGNLLSPAFVLNSAYEVMCMTDVEYYNFLESKGLTEPANLIFPVIKDLAQEREEDRQAVADAGPNSVPHPPTPNSEAAGAPVQAKPFRRHQFVSDASGEMTSRSSATASGTVGSPTANGKRRRRSSIQLYLSAIERHNASGGVFSDQSGSQSAAMSPSASHVLRPEGSVSVTGPVTTLDDLPDLLRQLPSREEYITLYLVNDLAWSSVRKNGFGHQTKGLWVSLAKGFMSSPVAKSPLLHHCCSRVIREVLCIGAN